MSSPTNVAARAAAPRVRKGHDAADLANPALYINRELSWLEFNQRVLVQAQDERHPLLERVKFLAIVAANLDEFFMVRVATLLRTFRSEVESVSPDGFTTEQQLDAVRVRANRMTDDIERCWSDALRPLLATERIQILDRADYTPAIETHTSATTTLRNIHPVLTPLAFDPGHPFPFISNLSMNLAVVVEHNGRTRFARVKLPDVLPRFAPIPAAVAGEAGDSFALLEDVVKLNVASLFPGADRARGAPLFRIIRDTDMVIQEDEADDLLKSVDRTLRELRYGDLSQLLVEASMPARVLNILIENFEIEEDVVARTSGRMGYADWSALDEAAPAPAQGCAVLTARALAGGRREKPSSTPSRSATTSSTIPSSRSPRWRRSSARRSTTPRSSPSSSPSTASARTRRSSIC